MCHHSSWDVPLVREDHILSEFLRVGDEVLPLLLTGEVVEEVLVKNGQFWHMRTSQVLLLGLPADGAEVSKLRDALLKEGAVHVEVLDAAGALSRLADVLVVTCELHSRLKIALNGSYSHILHEPL